jgi:hypothetical protein
MNATGEGALPTHVQLSDFAISLEPGPASRPQAVVKSLQVRVTQPGLEALLLGMVAEADRKAPVGLSLKRVTASAAGVDVVLRIEKSIFRSDLSTRLVFSAPGGTLLRVDLTELEMPAWVPFDPLLDEAIKRAGGAVRRDPVAKRALLLDPAELLTRFGVPGRFGPGEWAVATSDAGLDLAFQEQ